jgi:hypothetical protein
MPVLKLDLDDETAARLQALALAERRPTIWQAEVLLRQALGLPFPYPRPASTPATGAGDGTPTPAA